MVFTSPYPSIPLPTKPMHKWVFENLRKFEEERPNQPVFIDANTGEQTFGQQLYERTCSLANFLHKNGFGQGDFIMAALENRWEYMCSTLAACSLGGTVSGANPVYTEHELLHQTRLCAAKIVIVQAYALPKILSFLHEVPHVKFIFTVGLEDSVENPKIKIIRFEDIMKIKASYLPNVEIDVKKDIYSLPASSGTTGLRKGVIVTHFTNAFATESCLSFYTDRVAKKIDKNWNWRDEKFLIALPLGFGYGQLITCVAMMSGATAVFNRTAKIEDVAAAIDKYQIKTYFLSPMLLLDLIHWKKTHPESLKSLRMVIAGGGPIKDKVAAEIRKYLGYVTMVGQCYGMTECMLIACHDLMSPNPVTATGRIVPNTEVRVWDPEAKRELGVNEIGEVQVRLPSCTPGYLNNPKANAELYTADGWMDTGDIGYVDEDSFVFLVDRKKEMIKVSGRQVSPAELEDLLMGHPKVKDCVVVGLPDEETDERITGFVVKADESLTEEECLMAVNSEVSGFKKIVGGIHFMDIIPRNPNGKVLRRKIKEMYADKLNNNLVK
ncbi:unnamed protein product [Bursaphelenchus xylophilus]|uniref:(pine wood nematode) hypothetical protein n=1 Tax=Bursaphelenchus xylophilus TaxID=6326 RepID=A0A1I7RK15_BURXY|nr:unnamed protein product [Bursaphelenchus xylophilus]CAG9131575.1 unnamed protein product [Bursaphelenchus xylophilus]